MTKLWYYVCMFTLFTCYTLFSSSIWSINAAVKKAKKARDVCVLLNIGIGASVKCWNVLGIVINISTFWYSITRITVHWVHGSNKVSKLFQNSAFWEIAGIFHRYILFKVLLYFQVININFENAKIYSKKFFLFQRKIII